MNIDTLYRKLQISVAKNKESLPKAVYVLEITGEKTFILDGVNGTVKEGEYAQEPDCLIRSDMKVLEAIMSKPSSAFGYIMKKKLHISNMGTLMPLIKVLRDAFSG